MILLTGKKGIVLLEVLTAVAILSIGIAIVFKPLLAGLNAIVHSDYRMEALNLLDSELWEMQSQLKHDEAFSWQKRDVVVSGKTKLYNFSVTPIPTSEDNKLYKISLKISWLESNHEKSLRRECLFRAQNTHSLLS